MKFRKKPVVVEATQWFKMGDHPAVFMQDSYTQAKISPSVTSNKVPVIKTLEGDHLVTPGDWIITGVKGEHYPCKPDIFEMTYEKVEARGEQWDELAIQEGIRKPWETLLMMTKTAYGLYAFTHKDLEQFAALVAAHERESVAASSKRDLTCVCGAVWDGEQMVHAPPKREWVGLTLNEAEDFYEKYTDRAELINAIDRFLEEKNA